MHRVLQTPLCRLLGMDVPILQAPMAGGWTSPELVAAVTNAGGLGSLAAARIPVEALEAAIAAVRARTSGPFGVNFHLAPPEPFRGDIAAVKGVLDPFRHALGLPLDPGPLTLKPSGLEDQLELVFQARVPLISFAMGHPGHLIERAHAAGARVLVMVTTVEEAVEVAGAGADVVIAQGAEAGGHRSTFHTVEDIDLPLIGTLALVPQVVDAVDVPVIAAGGIMDGRGVVAALALGASAVQLGTRFLLARESSVFESYRQRLRSGRETDTQVTRLLTGRPARALRNRLLRELESSGVAALPWPYQAAAAEDIYRTALLRGDGDAMPLLAGQGLRLSGEDLGAADIVRQLVSEAETLLESWRS